MRAPIDDTLTITPPLRSSPGSMARLMRTVAKKFRSKLRLQSLSSMSRNPPIASASASLPPTLLTRMSRSLVGGEIAAAGATHEEGEHHVLVTAVERCEVVCVALEQRGVAARCTVVGPSPLTYAPGGFFDKPTVGAPITACALAVVDAASGEPPHRLTCPG